MGSLKWKELLCIVHAAVLLVTGIFLMLISAYLLYKVFHYNSFSPPGSSGPFIILFIFGLIHILVSWLGFRGPPREHNFHIILFMVLSIIILVGEFSTGVYSMVLWGRAKEASTKLLTDSFETMIRENTIKKEWLRLQVELSCCGLNGANDYTYAKSCVNLIPSNPMEGCKAPYVKYIKRTFLDGAILGFLFTLLQALGFLIFGYYYKALKEARQKRLDQLAAQQREENAQNNAPQSRPSTTSA